MSLFARAATHVFISMIVSFSLVWSRITPYTLLMKSIHSLRSYINSMILTDSVLYEIPRISIPCFKFEYLFEHVTLKAECYWWEYVLTFKFYMLLNSVEDQHILSRYLWSTLLFVDLQNLVGGLVAIFYFPINLGNNHHPNWRTHIFERGGPTTNREYIRNS